MTCFYLASFFLIRIRCRGFTYHMGISSSVQDPPKYLLPYSHHHQQRRKEWQIIIIMKAKNTEREVKRKKGNGRFIDNLRWNTKDIKAKRLWGWLPKNELKCETQSLLVSSQNQAANTNSVPKNIILEE